MNPLHRVVLSAALLTFRASVTQLAAQEIETAFKYVDAKAAKVEVAGEFSNWKILPMVNDGAGNWTTTLHLKPGYYAYKFVVNGEWLLDPANPAKKSVSGIDNSGISVGGVAAPATPAATGAAAAGSGKLPVSFSLSDSSAKSVHVAGEFNNWLDNDQGRVSGRAEWQLQNDGAGNWRMTTALPPGRYKFKYVVDGGDRWVKDPNLPTTPDDNSLLEVKGAGSAPAAATGKGNVTFTYSNPTAKTVHIAGKFNNWLDNTEGRVTGHNEWQMQNDGAGNWSLTASVPPGRQPFKYVVDGGDRWEQDPKMPSTADGNSVIELAGGGGVPATGGGAAVAGQAIFTYNNPNAGSVFVAGEFNQWSTTANPMTKDAAGNWSVSVPLKAGKYQYKFVVDGNWHEDAANPEKADDGLGGKNSVKIVQ